MVIDLTSHTSYVAQPKTKKNKTLTHTLTLLETDERVQEKTGIEFFPFFSGQVSFYS